jgi:hypothetical protein
MYSVLNCHIVAKHTEFYLGWLRFNVTSIGNAECFKKSGVEVTGNAECFKKLFNFES